MRHAALQRGAMPPISAAADFNAAPPSSSRRCRFGRSLWKVLTYLSDLNFAGLDARLFLV
jgi:hypothetical protein